MHLPDPICTEYGLMNRRRFLVLAAAGSAVALAGCATNPVTGKSQLMLLSEDQEIRIDRENSPHQFSSDYGVSQDRRLVQYIEATGKSLTSVTHRPRMPYAFKPVNAVYVNAYAFPGGSIAVTRGILLAMQNEAELAALLGHELGHVNARHTAQQMTKGMLTQALVGGLSLYAGAQSQSLGQLASQLGQLGAGALLASYSRDNEREADALGMEYMTRAGYGSKGFVGLMEMLRKSQKEKPGALELMFSTHPMSDERFGSALAMAGGQYRWAESAPLQRERYMDNTASLRAIADAIENLQAGEAEMGKKRYGEAEALFRKALGRASDDYAGLLLMAKCQLAQNRNEEALRYAEAAKSAYPQEAQALHISGFSAVRLGRFDSAYRDFSRYGQMLPGNANTTFFRGYSLEGMGRKPDAAQLYRQYLQTVNQGDQAKYAYGRLVQWGYVK